MLMIKDKGTHSSDGHTSHKSQIADEYQGAMTALHSNAQHGQPVPLQK